MIDVAVVAAEAAKFLAPLLPFLIKLGKSSAEAAAEDSGEKIAGAAWAKAKSLWAKLRPGLRSRPAAAEAAGDLAAAPEDQDAQAAFRVQLKKVLAGDDALAHEVASLWQEMRPMVIAAGKGSVAVGGDVSGSTIVTGDGNVIGGAKDPGSKDPG